MKIAVAIWQQLYDITNLIVLEFKLQIIVNLRKIASI